MIMYNRIVGIQSLYSGEEKVKMAIASAEALHEIADITGLSESEMIVTLALHLYGSGKLSRGEVRRLTGLSVWEFYRALGEHDIPINYGVEDLEADMETARKLGLIKETSRT